MTDYILSIIIPTKNRQFYCKKAVEQILTINNPSIQIVIQDNSDDNSLQDEIIALGSAQVKYHYHSGVISFVDNFSEAIILADGKYLCMIGDDDGVLPNIIDAVHLAEEQGYDAIIPGLNSVYCWPTPTPFIKNAEKGYLCLSFLKEGEYEIDPHYGLMQLMKSAGQNYQSLDLPRIYHGIVAKTALERVNKKTGKYFGGLTPDIYMSVALGVVCKKVCRLRYPITVSGMCPKSGSSDSATGKHTGNLEDAPHFRGHSLYEWDQKAPRIYSVESIWAETALQALKDFNETAIYNMFRVDRLDAICLWKYPQFKDIIKKHAKEHKVSTLKLYLLKFHFQYTKIIKSVLRKVFRKRNSVKKYYNVAEIGEAVDLTQIVLGKLETNK